MALVATKISNTATDNFRQTKGKYVTSADGDNDYIVLELPKKAFVREVVIDIKTAYTAASTGTLTVGVKEPGVAIDVDQIAADGVTLSEAVGQKTVHPGLYLENGGVVTMGIVKGDSAANVVARLWVTYSVIH